MTIATLIAADRLDERLVDGALRRIAGARFVRWIDQGDAADIEAGAEPAAIRAALEGWGSVDVVVHPPGPREKRLLIADMDSTMIEQECIDELADFARVQPQVAEITERAMRGELDFADALKERVALLRGLDSQVIRQCLAERIRPTAGAKTLVRTMRERGTETVLVSGGFTAFVEPIAEMIGFARFEANILGLEAEQLTGATEGRIVDAERKRQLLVEVREQLALSPDDTLAIGDGANDIPMVKSAGLGIGFHPKPALAAVADAVIAYNDLRALLWAQGIPRREWIED